MYLSLASDLYKLPVCKLDAAAGLPAQAAAGTLTHARFKISRARREESNMYCDGLIRL